MNSFRHEKPRVRMNAQAYRQLCQSVLERDSWRCQNCGTMQNLQVHHKQLRSRLGDDSEENLITLCNDCHGLMHGIGRSNFSTKVTETSLSGRDDHIEE